MDTQALINILLLIAVGVLVYDRIELGRRLQVLYSMVGLLALSEEEDEDD